MNDHPYLVWFCPPQKTIEEAQSFYEYGIFKPAAIFKKGAGFHLAYIREMNTPPRETAQALEKFGYKMVACADPLLGVWKPHKEQNDTN